MRFHFYPAVVNIILVSDIRQVCYLTVLVIIVCMYVCVYAFYSDSGLCSSSTVIFEVYLVNFVYGLRFSVVNLQHVWSIEWCIDTVYKYILYYISYFMRKSFCKYQIRTRISDLICCKCDISGLVKVATINRTAWYTFWLLKWRHYILYIRLNFCHPLNSKTTRLLAFLDKLWNVRHEQVLFNDSPWVGNVLLGWRFKVELVHFFHLYTIYK